MKCPFCNPTKYNRCNIYVGYGGSFFTASCTRPEGHKGKHVYCEFKFSDEVLTHCVVIDGCQPITEEIIKLKFERKI